MKMIIHLLKPTILYCLLILTSLNVYGQDANYKKGKKAFENKKYETSVKLLKQYADEGDCYAQYVLGFCYSIDTLSIANDSLSEVYSLSASLQKHTHAMGILATLYFKKSYSDKSYNIQALVWSELAAKYDIVQQGLTTRYLIRAYMTKEEIEEAEKIIAEKMKVFDKMKTCT